MIGAALVVAASAGHAEEAADRARARAAYDRGVAAQARGELSVAARAFAEADAIVPSSAALSAGLEAAESAGDAVIGAELCARAAARVSDQKAPPERAAFCEAARKKTATVVIACTARAPGVCEVTIDEAAATAGKPVFVLPGTHTARARRGAYVWSTSFTVIAGQARSVEAPEEPAASGAGGGSGAAQGPPETPSKRLISPAWAIAAGVLAGASLGAAIGSGADTKSKHDAFVGAGCPGEIHGDCSAIAKAGASAQDRTNALVGVTVGLGVAAATLGAITIFATRSEPRGGRAGLVRGAAIVARPGGVGVSVALW